MQCRRGPSSERFFAKVKAIALNKGKLHGQHSCNHEGASRRFSSIEMNEGELVDLKFVEGT